ncbi:hypothetical protein JW865_04995 [Candidatus Bathyarchaeota archaeon]|nr:hypothetical protein [Candidatus Bathyarchaeota archaeon]
MDSERRGLLLKLLDIEKAINDIELSTNFRKLKKNLKNLESFGGGSRKVRIDSPDNMEETIEFKSNSADMKITIEKYKENLDKYVKRLNLLYEEKSNLKKQLFP